MTNDFDESYLTEFDEGYLAEFEEIEHAQDPAVIELAEIDAAADIEFEAGIDEKADLAYRQSPISAQGPTAEEYDYRGAYRDGVSFETDANSGGVKLPNKHIKPGGLEVAGYDLATNEKIRDIMDDDGYIRTGVQMLRESIYDTAAGTPIQDTRALANIAWGVLAHGGYYGDFANHLPSAWGDEQIQWAWETAVTAAERHHLEAAIESGVISDPGSPEPPQEIIDSDLLHEHAGWLEAARGVYQGVEGEDFTGTNEELSEWAVDKMAAFEWNTVYMAMMTGRVLNGDDAFKKAFYDLLTTYDKVDTNFSIVAQSAGSALWDPVNWLAGGVSFGLGLAAKQATKIAAKHTLMQVLKRQLSSRIVQAAVGEGVIGGIQEGGRSYATQKIGVEAGALKEVDVGKVAGDAAIGFAGGALIGGGLAKIGTTDVAKNFAHWGKGQLKKLGGR